MASGKMTAQARRQRLLSALADGEFHSGERLAKRLRISRGGVWKSMESLRALGIEIQSVPKQGYRFARPIDLLDKAAILAAMPAATRTALDRVDVLLTVDSTNRHLVDAPAPSLDHAALCVAELQTAGRGRRGRSWVAPFGSGVCMSLSWQFQEAPPTFSALSLAVGVAVVRALRKLGAEQVGLKWPNDLIAHHRKLGGILIEMQGESDGPARVVIGIGINMRMPTAVRLKLAEQQATLLADVHELLLDKTPKRNQVIAAVTSELIAVLREFAQSGFAAFADEWRGLDTLADAPVKVLTAAGTTLGIAKGVDDDGTLLVEVDGELRRFVSGDVSLRAAR
jgi:BirA family biotin operon repressor/biotin-[acetyl-CoA-carboxylase] ligase